MVDTAGCEAGVPQLVEALLGIDGVMYSVIGNNRVFVEVDSGNAKQVRDVVA